MNQKHILWVILLFFIASLDVCLVHSLEENGPGKRSAESQLASKEEAFETLRAFMLRKEDYKKIAERIQSEDARSEAVLAYLFCQSTGKQELADWCQREQSLEPELYGNYVRSVGKLLADAVYFPVPEAMNDEKAKVSYENSWQNARTYGGERGHEGCDIMANIQKRGYYPIVSTSDGTVEKIGWLPQGGYRIGIRSPHGVYYYYAHLAEYEDGMEEGAAVTAGQLIGYMGDTGYSEIEGTTGNFPVHLHFGMYLNDADGQEVSFNTYYLLQILEHKKLKYVFKRS